MAMGMETGNDSIGNIARLSEVSITLAMVRFLASFTTIQGPFCIGTVVMERYVRWSEDGSTDHHLNSGLLQSHTSVMQFVCCKLFLTLLLRTERLMTPVGSYLM